ncbi:pyrroloquinoline quinone biosynthesis protein PqqB [Streptomyces carminius]|uniref:Coenzyme PQQ synthesis protein B n=1 Tax=Streptomyces carminius TaxID=2665496 RepID=A0A2M8LV98_9ACTN|nr:pyrroloquinoline quinone biosynthesis protein PqqB [Streptomyces carminius]PJE95878.1 pyrroloquinoline quinone biosynthesis protein PqqB [Streptomyces carminius]
MRVRVLGTAAGGGLPQWNCACEVCGTARAAAVGRTQDCLAVSGDGTAWWLVNASPDIRAQLLAAPELAPGPARRQTPLRGALLTSAELDHTLGLAALREARDFTVHGTATVLGALPVRGVIDPYGGFRWSPAGDTELELAGGLTVRAVPVGRKRPRYAAGAPDAGDWVVAYRLTDRRTGGVLVYAPCLAAWPPALAAAAEGADCVLLDGSFFTDDEMTERTGAGPTALDMGHLPISDSLAHRASYPSARWLYTHLNNTNPALVADSPQRRAVERAGAEVAADGMLLEL